MSGTFVLAVSLFSASVFAQQPGTLTPEVHPILSSQRCTRTGGCVTVNTSIVLDSSYRFMHEVGGTTKCNDLGFNSSICPDVETCGKNCEVEGVDYASCGIKTEGDTLTLNLFTQKDNVTTEASPRVYLMADETTYDMLTLLNQEFTFDVDMSQVPCGTNGALYLSEMNATGFSSDINTAGAGYGTGYCDAQCPKQTFVNGEANLDSTYGACCNEMDIWESNSAATAYTPHSCNITGSYACPGSLCSNGVCDQGGCDFNPYRMGNKEFYGPNNTVDTTRKFTVVTQFLTSDGTPTGTLQTITRKYVQDGIVIENSNTSVSGMDPVNSISDAYCDAETTAFGGTNPSRFESLGGMKAMGEALGRGMVLVFSLWMDHGSGMLWLDGNTSSDSTSPGAARGPCSADSGDQDFLTKTYPDTQVVFSNVKVGDIGSTFGSD